MYMLCRQHHLYNLRARVLLALITVWTLLVSGLGLNPAIRVSASSKGSPPAEQPAGATLGQSSAAQAQETYGKMSLQFEKNVGQTDPQVQFVTRAEGATVFLTNSSAVFVLSEIDEPSLIASPFRGLDAQRLLSEEEPSVRTHALRMNIENARPGARVEGINKLPGVVNYLIGNDSTKWHANIPTFGQVQYNDVYSGIDMVYYGNQQQLEYDFVVKPGADASQVALTFDGADRISVDSNGDLRIETPLGTVRQLKPLVYQEDEVGRQEVPGGYSVQGSNRVGFTLGAYDKSRQLVIDPVLAYSTYLGGAAFELGRSVSVDAAGNAYVMGQTFSVDFPTSLPLQGTNKGSTDLFVSKLNATGSMHVYSTYLGGSQGEFGLGITVDSAGVVCLTGQTGSSDFPTQNALFPTFQNLAAFVTKLNAGGNGIVFSTYLDSSGIDQGHDIETDAAGNVYVTGWTRGPNFPTKNPFQPGLRGSIDAFLSKFSPDGSSLQYSTYLGGDLSDGQGLNFSSGYGIAVDELGHAYVTGETFAANFPTRDELSTNLPGDDAFVTKINTNASGNSSLVYSTYVGGSLGDAGSSIALDSAGNVYVTGITQSNNFPASKILGVVSNDTAFVSKISPTGSQFIYSVLIGGSDDEFGAGIQVDPDGNAYIVGYTSSTNFPTSNPIQPNFGGGTYDAFVAKLNVAGSGFVYSTYLGGSANEFGSGIALDSTENTYIVGDTQSIDFPVTDPFQSRRKGTSDAFVAKIGNIAIAGRVVDANNNGLASTTVTLSGPDSTVVETDASGFFGFIKITLDGEYNVTPFRTGMSFAPNSIHINNLTSNRDLVFIGAATGPTPSPSPSPSASSASYQFSAASFSANEDVGQFQVIVTRSGNTSQPTSVEYATTDGTANDRGDYTTAIGKLNFGAGETTKSFNIFITDDVYQEGNETINVTLSNPSVGSQLNGQSSVVLTIVDNDLFNGTANPIDSTAFFVRQHYVDFLNRAPDAPGLAFWINNIDSCGIDLQCREVKRIDTSAAFFLSIEFQQTGFLVERMYRAAFNRFPQYREFLRDTQHIGHDLIVGQGGWQTQLAANQQDFIDDFVTRSNFTAVYAGLSNMQYVDALNANTTGSLSVSERNDLIAGLNAMTETRGTVLKKVAEDPDFISREFNAGFVLMEFIGYLRRNPSDFPDSSLDGFNFWLAKLNQFNGDFRQAEMVKAFLSSSEYRQRFGSF